jgi:ribonuclease PH
MIEVETDIVSHASGSARLRLANTDILVGVKTEIDTPYPEKPREGKIEFFVDWYVQLYASSLQYVRTREGHFMSIQQRKETFPTRLPQN